ncbi:hypothetical protein Ahy_B01g051618 [Arachis hypogaea]|uniref:Uncharacterized protein n=1 Tax=Arachis hypogaea TaxID=3818 RepID=A0A445AME1_ARAHY|nr:hypothetical protein Ahy_B01g051618 [Arachis hypogaea]
MYISMEDTTIIGGKYLIPKGSHVLIERHALGRNPKVWNEPHKFNPQHHLTNSSEGCDVVLSEPDLRFISFGTGRSGCDAICKVGSWLHLESTSQWIKN